MMNNLTLVGSETRILLERFGFPPSDLYSLPLSQKRFEEGGQYGIEISSVNNPKILKSVLALADASEIIIDRVDECRGIFRLLNNEIKEMVQICHERQIGLIMSVGPRAIYDTSAFAQSKNGSRMGYRLRGMENIIRATEDVKRAVDFGVRGFLVYDEGLLMFLNSLKNEGVIPRTTLLKLSVHAGCANPLSARLFEKSGADTINPIPDLDLPMLSAMRQAVNCPLDIFTDTAQEAGGFIRTYEVPEFIRIAAPVYLKCGPISQPRQNHLPTPEELGERMKQTARVLEMIATYYPEAIRVSCKERTLGLPDI